MGTLCELPLQEALQLAYGNNSASRPSLIDLRESSIFMVSRLRGSYSVPLDSLVARMFLLPDRATPLGLVVAGPPPLQTIKRAATAGCAKKEMQLAAFLMSRGWQVAFCVEATADLWRLAAAMGVLEEGGCALSLKRRWAFQPSKLLMQQAGLVEALLVNAHLQQGATSHAAVGDVTNRSRTRLAGEAGGVEGTWPSASGCTRAATLRVLDVGCGSGRDLAWLATRSSTVKLPAAAGGASAYTGGDAGHMTDVHIQWECVGLDSWHGALQRAAEVLALGEVPAGTGGVTLHLVQIGPGTGALTSLPLPPGAGKTPQVQLLQRYLTYTKEQLPHECAVTHSECTAACSDSEVAMAAPVRDGGSKRVLELAALGCFDLVVCVRFLERSFLQSMAELLKPGGVILFSTFVDGPGLRAFGRPQGHEHVLQPDELSNSFFGPNQGFQVLRNDVEAIPDGREVSMFCARKHASA